MADINVLTVTGRLTENASQRVLASGKTVLTANIANNTGFGDHAQVVYIKVQQWCTKPSGIYPYLIKGKLIGATGELSRSEWIDQNGKLHVDFILTTFDIKLLSSKSEDTLPYVPAADIVNEINDTDSEPVF